MAEIQGLKKLQDRLKKMREKAEAEKNVSVIVGYTAAYAIYVHEKMEMKWKGKPRKGRKGRKGKGKYWDPQGRAQPKFLEQPARELAAKEFPKMVEVTFQKTGSLKKALLVCGLRLQRESQQLVPVDTGNLKASAFTRVEE